MFGPMVMLDWRCEPATHHLRTSAPYAGHSLRFWRSQEENRSFTYDHNIDPKNLDEQSDA